MRVSRFILVACLILAGSSSARAELVYTLGFSDLLYIGQPGDKVSVDLIVRESATAGEQLRFFSTTSGLTAFGPMTIDYAPIAPSLGGVSIADVADVSINSIYPDTVFNRIINIDNVAHTLEIGGVTTGLGIKSAIDQSSFMAVLATIQFTVTGNLGDWALLKVNRHPLGNLFFDNELNSTDTAANTTYGTARVAVPEPSSAMLLMLAGCVGVFRRNRRT
jgi:hypothetical protein